MPTNFIKKWEQSSEFPADCMHCLSICLESFSFFHSIQILQKIENLNKTMLLSVEDWILFTPMPPATVRTPASTLPRSDCIWPTQF